ncbi:adenylate/guanylate cyclase domain-containing protein [Chitinophaga sp. RAB17]|uniref:adenylate/guanylate cyclase domain-containing protein n=1 Tax=Chitinophaga sp. RAB17 TaxID=3233049 RepID=UPI003F920C3A
MKIRDIPINDLFISFNPEIVPVHPAIENRILGQYKYAMLSPKIKRNISRLIPFGVIWLIFGIVYSQLERGLLGGLQYYPGYKKEFGLLPVFKAGFHLGKVTTGGIGVIKKEIIFTGDVLNTTARIQGLCNTYEVDILISDKLIKKLNLPTEFQIKSLGKNELRGRDEKVELFTIGGAN